MKNGMRTRTPYAPGAALLPNLMLLLLISDMTETGQPKWLRGVKRSKRPTLTSIQQLPHNGFLPIIDSFGHKYTNTIYIQ